MNLNHRILLRDLGQILFVILQIYCHILNAVTLKSPLFIMRMKEPGTEMYKNIFNV